MEFIDFKFIVKSIIGEWMKVKNFRRNDKKGGTNNGTINKTMATNIRLKAYFHF